MKKLIILLLLTSCSPTQRLARIYERNPHLKPEVSVDSVITKTDTLIYRDTVVELRIVPDTIIKTDTVTEQIFIEPDVPSDTLTAESIYSIAESWIYNRNLNLSLITKDTTIMHRLDSAIVQSNYWEYKYRNETKVGKVYVTSKWKEIMAWVGVAIGIILLGYFIAKITSKIKL